MQRIAKNFDPTQLDRLVRQAESSMQEAAKDIKSIRASLPEYETGIFTPTWSGTLGNGTLKGFYTRVGNLMTVNVSLVWGNTTSHGASTQTFQMPLASGSPTRTIGSAWLNDSGTAVFTGVSYIAPEEVKLKVFFNNDSAGSGLTGTAPFTWTTNDELFASLTYFVK